MGAERVGKDLRPPDAAGAALVLCGALWMAAAAPVAAQTRALGVVVGPVQAFHVRDAADRSATHAGFMAGAWADVQTPARMVSVLAEATVARRGAVYRFADSFDRQVDVDYLTASVLPTLRLDVGPVAVLAFAGPALDVFIRAQASPELELAFRNAESQVLAGIVGGGVEYRRGRVTVRLDGRIHRQLTASFMGETDDVRHRSTEFAFRLGMRPRAAGPGG